MYQTSYRTHTCGELTSKDVGKEVTLAGWVKSLRFHGKLVFVDLYDRFGVTQIVINSEKFDVKNITKESVLQVSGIVRLRPEKNPKLYTGEIEVEVNKLNVLSISGKIPIDLTDETTTNEEMRLKYRYLDLRRRTMQNHLLSRFQFSKAVRDFLSSHGFVEIETPILTKSTPEGARDFLVPSRKFPGKFYALPQSPQQFKQLLMVAGFDRYFQIARCFRDEDSRADRQPEFTQIDIEMSFVNREDVIAIVEKMLKYSFASFGINVKIPIKRLTYEEAMNDYGIDHPDLRFKLKLFDATEVFENSDFLIFKQIVENGGVIKGINFKHGSILSTKQIKKLESVVKENGGKGLSYIVLKDEPTGNLSKFWPQIKEKLNVDIEKGDVLLFVADEWKKACEIAGKLRIELFNIVKSNENLYKLYSSEGLIEEGFKFVWIVDFPLFSWSEEEQRFVSEHHPFTSPKPEFIEELKNPEKRKKWLDKLDKIIAESYDIVLNGYEIGGGSIRISDLELQRIIFEILKLTPEEIDRKFGHLINAFSYGAPPHGGIALGLDRIVAIIAGVDSIREVIAFPKNKNAYCPLDDSPSEVDEKQLKELHLKLDF